MFSDLNSIIRRGQVFHVYERPKKWELIPEYWRNICLWVSVSIPLQITLGVLFIIVQVSSLLGYFGKFDYFVLPQEFSHILCAHNLFLPAWYIYDNLFQTGILSSKKAVHLLQRRCRRIPRASLVSTLVQSIPNWNTLFKKGCESAAAQMSQHYTGIAS